MKKLPVGGIILAVTGIFFDLKLEFPSLAKIALKLF